MKSISPMYFDEPEKHIPQGMYCYEKEKVCPFWDRNDRLPKEENGYCHYLQQGDWDANEEGGVVVNLHTDERKDVSYLPFSGMLWDKVKECTINDEED